MKRKILRIIILALVLSFSCKRKNKEAKNKTESIQVESISQTYENIISKNTGKYANDISLFKKNDISVRLKKLTGSSYEEIVKKFNVQTPIVSENNIYKLTGCLKNNCPTYMVTILYDSSNDNLNVLVDQSGKIIKFSEKEKIHFTKILKSK